MDKQTLHKIFSNKTSRKDTTNQAYAQRLASFANRYGKFKEEKYTDWEWMKNKDDVLYFIKEVPNARKDKEGNYTKPSPPTQIGYLNPIIEYLKEIGEHSLADDYNVVKLVIDDQIQKKKDKSKGITETQKENIISYEDLVKYCEKIDEEIKLLEQKPLQTHLDLWTLEDLKSLKILMRMYLLHPSGNEYATLRFITLKEYKKIKQPELNYVVIGSAKSYISITNYKTDQKYGNKLSQIVDKPLLKMLKDLKKQRDIEEREHLFYLQKTGTPWDNNNLCAIMTKYSKKFLDGKSIGSTLLYKIVIQEAGLNYNEALENDDITSAVKFNEILAQFAKSRGHSQKIQKNTYIVEK